MAPETKEMINNCFAALDGYTRRERELEIENNYEKDISNNNNTNNNNNSNNNGPLGQTGAFPARFDE